MAEKKATKAAATKAAAPKKETVKKAAAPKKILGAGWLLKEGKIAEAEGKIVLA